ncbi:uncharacterized protein JCM6883_007453 [Sporobolomyces salmoneus]|uniref:uncharacterized protein n=1 Tax=Sporobolomyces salmoneus TaxID=183962 RepID=UPI003177E4E6
MSPQLPVELLRIVVNNFRLPPFTSNLHTRKLEDETRSTLYTLSLTNRVFNEIARPLLYNFVRLPAGKTVKTLSLLINNNLASTNLASTGTVVFEAEPDGWHKSEQASLGELAHLLREIPSRFRSVRQLVSYSNFWSLERLHGLGLSRVFLNDVQVDTTAISRLTFPSLVVLGLSDVYLSPDFLQASSFPSLRHLIFEASDEDMDSGELTSLAFLSPQLDSSTLILEDFLQIVNKDPSQRLASILVNVSARWFNELKDPWTIVNLRLLLPDAPTSMSLLRCASAIEAFAIRLRDPRKSACLESIYLSPPSSLSAKYRTDELLASIEHMTLAAKDRNIEVVYEEQSKRLTGECGISEVFMRRMTQKRIDREAAEEGKN